MADPPERAPPGPPDDFTTATTGPEGIPRVDEAELRRAAPPPPPPAAIDPALDIGVDDDQTAPLGDQEPPRNEVWQAVRRSVPAPRAPRPSGELAVPLGVVDVDARPLDRRSTGLMSPWQAPSDPGLPAEGEAALEALPELRRATQGVVEQRRPLPGWVWALVAVVLLGGGFAGAALWRAQGALPALTAAPAPRADRAPPAADPPRAAPAPTGPADEAGLDAAPSLEVRKRWRSELLAAHRKGRYDEALAAAARLEEWFDLDWEAALTAAEAARLGRRCDVALQRYAAFVDAFAKNARVADAHFGMAECLRQQGDLKAARLHYRATLERGRGALARQAKKRLSQLGP